MVVRVATVDEYQFLICLKHQVWGANNRAKKWEIGSYLVFTIEKNIVALAKVIGDPYFSNEIIWDNGLFEYRNPLEFIHILSRDQWIPYEGKIKKLFTDSWGDHYGTGILNKKPLSIESGKELIKEITRLPNSISQYRNNIDRLITESFKEREAELTGKTESKFRKFKDKLIEIDD